MLKLYVYLNFFFQAVSSNLGTGKIKNITKEEALLNKEIEVQLLNMLIIYFL